MARLLIPAAPSSPRHSAASNPQRWNRRNTRRAHHKVKSGCQACKGRRQKCDEQRPSCSGCKRHGTECQYAPPKLQLKSPSFTSSQSPDSHKPTSPSPSDTLGNVGPMIRSPPSDLNHGDLELLHQYLTSTCMATAQRPEVTAYIQINTPRLGQQYPFVMRGIFAMAATHLSRLRPSLAQHYATLAASHHNAALPAYRNALQKLDHSNCQALVSYSKSLLWCSYAGLDSLTGFQQHCRPTAMTAEDQWQPPPWFLLLRGSCLVVESSRTWIRDGPHVLPEIAPPHTASSDGIATDDHYLSLLSLLSRREPSGTKRVLCESALEDLRASFARGSMTHHNTPLRNAMNYWMGRISDDFLVLLRKKESWALVILAHFCVLAHRSEKVWFMQGNAKGLLLSIMGALDDDWREYIHWPCEELGV